MGRRKGIERETRGFVIYRYPQTISFNYSSGSIGRYDRYDRELLTVSETDSDPHFIKFISR